MPKNVALALPLKSSLRSKEYITLLNRFGDCISYDDALRVETAWGNNVLSDEDGYATIPSNIQEGLFFQAASDNGDYCQEYNSFHITNTILYQDNANGNFALDKVLQPLLNKNFCRRSIKLNDLPLEKVPYNSCNPCLSKCYSNINVDAWFSESNPEIYMMQFINLSWAICRNIARKRIFIDTPNLVPGWTSFHCTVSNTPASSRIYSNHSPQLFL